MKKIVVSILTALAVGTALALPAPADAAQGGDDRNGGRDRQHVWIKVGANELVPGSVKGISKACQNIFGYGYPKYRPCEHLEPGLVNARFGNMNARGYWAEWYYNTNQLRSGVW